MVTEPNTEHRRLHSFLEGKTKVRKAWNMYCKIKENTPLTLMVASIRSSLITEDDVYVDNVLTLMCLG